MSIIIAANLQKDTLKEINKYIPVSRRSKLISQYIEQDSYVLPNTEKGIRNIIEWDKTSEMVIQPIFLSPEAAHKIDQIIDELEKKIVSFGLSGDLVGRSMVIRAITKSFADYVKNNPVEEQETQFFIVQVVKGTKERLSEHIDKMERSSTINQYILDEYEPSTDIKSLKARLSDERERITLYLDVENVLKKVEDIAESYGSNVKKTHIVRDAIYQLIEQLETLQPKKRGLEKSLSRAIEEIAKHANPSEVRELLEKYTPKS